MVLALASKGCVMYSFFNHSKQCVMKVSIATIVQAPICVLKEEELKKIKGGQGDTSDTTNTAIIGVDDIIDA